MKLEQPHDHVDWGQQGVISPGSPEGMVLGLRSSERERERKKEAKEEREREKEIKRERIKESIRKFTQDTG